jgi:co-chaperonin GroES (HSP10)
VLLLSQPHSEGKKSLDRTRRPEAPTTTEPQRLLRSDVAVIPIEDSDKSPSGLLHIPKEARQRCDQGIVKYRGPETKHIRVGDHVIFSGYAGTRITLAGEGILIILPEAEIEAIVTDSPIRLWTDAQIKQLLSEIQGDLRMTNKTEAELVDALFDLIRNRLDSFDFSEGLLF